MHAANLPPSALRTPHSLLRKFAFLELRAHLERMQLTSCQLPRRCWTNTRIPSFTVLCSILREEVHTAPAQISSPEHPLVLNPLFQTRRRVPGFWKHTENQRAFLEKVGNELGIKKVTN